MLADYRSLWKSAADTLQILNENVSQVLDLNSNVNSEDENVEISNGSDKEISVVNEGGNPHDRNNVANDCEESLLEEYKKLLEEEQMRHVELSKKFRLLLGEKDAEIAALKQRCDLNNEKPLVDHALDVEKIKQEKNTLEICLKETEDRLQAMLSENVECTVLRKRNLKFQAELEELRKQSVQIKSQNNQADHRRTETIEKLVEEYSQLAAENEASKTVYEEKIKLIEIENEELVTKIQALEHSLNTLADRAHELSSPSAISNSHASLELSGFKKKIVTLEFELNEKQHKIDLLTKSFGNFDATATVIEQSSQFDMDFKSLLADNAFLKQELTELHNKFDQLQQEKLESENAGRQLLELNKNYQVEIDTLRGKGNDDHNQVIQTLKNEKIELQEYVECLKKESESVILREKSAFKKELNDLKSQICEQAMLQQQSDLIANEKESEIQNCESQLQTKLCYLENEINSLQAALRMSKESESSSLQSLSNEMIQKLQDQENFYRLEIAKLNDDFNIQLNQLVEKHRADDMAVQERSTETEGMLLSQIDLLQGNYQTAIEEIAKLKLTNLDEMKAAVDLTKLQCLEEHKEELLLQLQKVTGDYEFKLQLELSKLKKEYEDSIAKKESELNESWVLKLHHEIENENNRFQKIIADELIKQKNDFEQLFSQETLKLKNLHLKELADQIEESGTKLQAALDARDQILNSERQKFLLELSAVKQECHAEMERIASEKSIVEAKLLTICNEKDREKDIAIEETKLTKDREWALVLEKLKCDMNELVKKAEVERDGYLQLYSKERLARKAIHNKLLEIQGNIRVVCRVRPILEVERKQLGGQGEVDTTEIVSEEEIIIHRDSVTKNRFEFDRVFGPESTQEIVFEAVQPLIISVLDGYNVCIFAYGQTGSGKTFTMEGYGDNIGVSPRSIGELFKIIELNAEDWTYTVNFSMLEIYNESIRDLLNCSNDKDKLDVRQTPEGNVVSGLTELIVTSPQQVLSLMFQGQSNRAVGAHDMNEHSSRSHSILTLTCRGKNMRDGSSTFGKLHMIDLAGSERVSKTDASGDRLKEAQNINKSLSALGDVINALGNKKSTHVPYRNSKLTFLLQDSLGGNSKVLMFVNISPSVYNVGESICSLNFAFRCRSVELGQAKKQTDSLGGVSSLKKSASSAAIETVPASPAVKSMNSTSSTVATIAKKALPSSSTAKK